MMFVTDNDGNLRCYSNGGNYDALEVICTSCNGDGTVDALLWHESPDKTYPGKLQCQKCRGVGRLLTREGERLLKFLQRHLWACMSKISILSATEARPQVEITDADCSAEKKD